MGKTLLVGLWACAVTLAATFGGAYWRLTPEHGAASQREEKTQARSIKPITVPVIVGGVLKGYVSAEFNIVSVSDGHGGGLDPESFVMDEAFRLIYADPQTDFSHLRKADLAALTTRLTANVNHRLGKKVIKETLVKNFTFVSREDLPR
ncbi:flagellar basal body-associated protein FliL [Methylocystis sp. JAN1]|uniref:flagellar basal body-associated protein FliL n=1 Tax=Methylocystis sp. JAN1 TaxID=3397211 RepID=UPI003FA2D1FD